MTETKTTPKPRIVMPVYDEVNMLDVCGPFEMFFWAGFDVQLVAEKPGPVRFDTGTKMLVEAGFDTVAPAAALWVPGGMPKAIAALIADSHGPYQSFVKAQAAQSDWVCSVCEGALPLAATGLLDGYEVTTHWAYIPYLLQYHPKVRGADGHPRFVVDRDRVTGGGISAGLDEALKLIELIADVETAEKVQRTTQYYPDPPVSSRIPNVISTPQMPPPPGH
jgi:transcriptional regulator GlxA family with amidase domain